MTNQNNQNRKPQAGNTAVSLQDRMYQKLKEDRIKTKLYLVNGYQLEGIIREFDNFTVLLIDNGKERLIFKHAISTIEPSRAIMY